MNLRRSPAFAASLAAILAFSPIAARAQAIASGTFDLLLSDQKVGKCVYKIEKAKNGYKLTSRDTFRAGNQDGDQTDEFKYTDAFGFIEGTTTDHNTLTQTSYVPSKARDSVTIAHFQGGGHDSNIVGAKPNLIVLTPFDAGAVQAALLLAVTHPTPNNLYSILIPGAAGRGGGGRRGGGSASDADPNAAAPDAPPPGPNAIDVEFLKGKETSGLLDGKPVLLNSFLFGVGGFHVLLYADQQNNLMQFTAGAFHTIYIRHGFQLNMGPEGAPIAPAKP